MTSRTLMEILQFIILEYLSLTTHYNFTSLTCWHKVRLYFNFNFLRVRSHKRRNELISVWDFKPAWKQVLFTWSFNSAGSQNDPIFWWICIRNFISGSVYMMFYYQKWNFISVKMTDMKSIPAMSFKTYMVIKRNIQQVCAYSFCFG